MSILNVHCAIYRSSNNEEEIIDYNTQIRIKEPGFHYILLDKVVIETISSNIPYSELFTRKLKSSEVSNLFKNKIRDKHSFLDNFIKIIDYSK